MSPKSLSPEDPHDLDTPERTPPELDLLGARLCTVMRARKLDPIVDVGLPRSGSLRGLIDNPDRVVVVVVDGELDSERLVDARQDAVVLEPARDGALLPVIHLASRGTALGCAPDEDLRDAFFGHGYDVFFVSGDDLHGLEQRLAVTTDCCLDQIARIQQSARIGEATGEPPCWPLMVVRA